MEDDLSKLINESWLTIATKNIHDMFLKKYLEIPMSGGCILGDIPTDYKEYCSKVPFVHINNRMITKKIIQIITTALGRLKNGKMKAKCVNSNLMNEFSFETGYNNASKMCFDSYICSGNTDKNMINKNKEIRSIVEPIVEPVVERVVEPVVERVIEPVVESVVEPIVEPIV